MSALAQHHARVTIGDGVDEALELPITDGTIRLDEEWMPYVQGALTCPFDPRVLDLDPQAEDIWLTITVTRSKGRTDRISDFTLRWAGRALAAITAQFAGETLAAITRSLYHDYVTPGAPRGDIVRSFRVMLREVVADHAAATVTMQVAGGESRLTDWLHMGPVALRAPGADLVAKINWTLNLAGFTDGLTSYPASVPSDAEIGEEALRAPGSSALDWLQQITRKHDLMCWCDEGGNWRLAPSRASATTRELTSMGEDRTVMNVTETISRDTGWVTAVMLAYTWEGVTQYDIASDWAPNPERAKVVRIDAPFPGVGRAARPLAQRRTRGRAVTVDAVSDPLITPGEMVSVTTAARTYTGRCASIQWRLDNAEMSLRLREVS